MMFSRFEGAVVMGLVALAMIVLGLFWLLPSAPMDLSSPKDEPLDINRASSAELAELPGLGPLLAERIIRYRILHGPFRSLEELLKIPGIGPKTLERLRPFVRICSLPACNS